MDAFHACEHGDESSVFFRILKGNAAYLSHSFADEGARHDRTAREVALEERFIHGDGFLPDRIVHRYHFRDLVDEKHRIAVWQDFHDFFNVQM